MAKTKIAMIFSLIIVLALIWWFMPNSLTSIDPEKVSVIIIFNGNTGNSTTISESDDVSYIIDSFNKTTIRKEKLSIGYMGYGYLLTIIKNDASIYNEFIINSANNIRKDPFFYQVTTNSIDYDYIQNLVD
ncbi:hypothetical protein [Dethiobacter alkaliphilus]|uniref:Uncharacterized protein n=1 Tax=Dethiobacter alkaliphilus AHT 1 TaxID=555088 RepID=C0GD74_DETAL|nr:hypothetical protein [Dethiobacter alkaliphilus]EEG78595.1 hypothetical protein DealDRAFT_0525 [Dethiobacter alkaliphilus AHT 1]